MRPEEAAGRLIRIRTENGAGRSTRTARLGPRVKNVIRTTRGLAWPASLRTLIDTCSRPPTGVQLMPVRRFTSCVGGAGGGAGGGTAIGPKSSHPVQPPGLVQVLLYIS